LSFNIKDPQSSLEDILDTVKAHNLKVNSLRMRKKSLEDIFIDLTGRNIRE
jgi:ABC-type multidrug transport system ATPase subunit